MQQQRFAVPIATPISPTPENDFGTYVQVSKSLSGDYPVLESYRRNIGRIGFAMINGASDLSKGVIEATKAGNLARADELLIDMEEALANFMRQQLDGRDANFLSEGFQGALPEDPGSTFFFRGSAQEYVEARLFRIMWPFITGNKLMMPELPTISQFGVNLQAILGGYIDVVGELAKAVTDERLASAELRSLELFERYISIAESIELRLSEVRHFPNNVISNTDDRRNGYSQLLKHRVQGTIANVKRDYALLRDLHQVNAKLVADVMRIMEKHSPK